MAYNNPKQVFEILEEFELATNKSKRKEVLLKYSDCQPFRDVLRGTFDESLEFKLPEGRPPFKVNKPESVPSSLLIKNKLFGNFVKGSNRCERLPDWKRENLFIELLESIHPADAEIVLSMVAKKSPVKFLTKKLVQEAFPTLITK